MPEQWYVIQNGAKVGPLPWERLSASITAGQLRPIDMVLKVGAQRWQPAGELPGLFAPPLRAAEQWFYIQDGRKLGPVGIDQLKEMARVGKLLVNEMVLRGGEPRWQYAGDVPNLFPAPVDEELDEEAEEPAEDEDEEVDIECYLERAAEFRAQGNYLRALAEYQELVELLPDEPEGHQGLAWIWATCPDAQFRHGAGALEYARRAVELVESLASTLEEDAEEKWLVVACHETLVVACHETLAAAHAEVADFQGAVAAIDRALAAAPTQEQARLRYRRLLFQAKRPCRDSAQPPRTAGQECQQTMA